MDTLTMLKCVCQFILSTKPVSSGFEKTATRAYPHLHVSQESWPHYLEIFPYTEFFHLQGVLKFVHTGLAKSDQLTETIMPQNKHPLKV